MDAADSFSPTDWLDRQSFAMAHAASVKVQQDFLPWMARVDHNDPFIQELMVRYRADFDASLHCASEHLLRVILRCARRYGVRFVSVSGHEVITCERVKWPVRTGWPAAWRIVKMLCHGLPLSHGTGNSNQMQVSLSEVMVEAHFGTYDVRNPSRPVLVGQPATLTGMRLAIEQHYDRAKPLADYLRVAGIEPIEPAVLMPQLNGRKHFYPLKSKIVVDGLNTDVSVMAREPGEPPCAT
jgi:hypothetical protein